MFLTGGFDIFDRRFWWFWQVVLMVLTAGFDGFDVLTVGFDDFDRWFWWFWWFWQVVLTAGFDVLTVGFDVLMILTGGFCFWRMYNKWQQVLMFLMILTVGFDGFDVLTAGFDVFDDFDSRFLCFWWFWHKVFVFEGCILNHVIMTVGFVLWRRCYQEIPLPPIAAYLGLCCEKLWRLFTAVNKKLIVYRIVY